MRRALRVILAVGLLAGCGEADTPDDALDAIHAPEIARIMPVEAVLAGAHIATLDPSTMNDAEIEKALGPVSRCDFRYTSTGKPVLALEANAVSPRGVVKLNGSLVMLRVTPPELAAAGGAVAGGSDIILAAGPIRAILLPAGLPSREATLVFEIGGRLRAGYRGYLECLPEPQ